MKRRLVQAMAILLLAGSRWGVQAQEPAALAMPRTLPSADAAPAGPPGQQPAPPQGYAYDLAQLTGLAEAYNPILQRDLARIEEARGSALQASLWSNPRFDTNNPQVFYARTILPNVGFQQEIPVAGKKRLDAAAAEKQVREAELALKQDRYDLFTAVRQQFYTTLAAQKRVEVLSELREVLGKSLEVGQKLKQARESSQIDVLLLRIDYQQAQVNVRQAQALLEGQRRQLAAIVGLPQLGAVTALGELSTQLPGFDEEAAQRYVVANHTSILSADAEIQRAKILLERARVEPYPNPYMGPAYQFGNIQGSSQFWFNIQFSIPVWDRNQGNILNARATVREAIESRTTAQNDLLARLADALARYRAARALAEEYERTIIPDAQEVMRLAQSAYARGLFEFARFLQAQRTVVESRSRSVDLLENVWRTAAEVAGLLQLDQFP